MHIRCVYTYMIIRVRTSHVYRLYNRGLHLGYSSSHEFEIGFSSQ